MGIEGSFGVGDLLFRTKYRLGSLDDFGFAAGLVLGMPTGNLEDFRGVGDVTIEPLLVVARDFGRNNVHMNLGTEIDASYLERSQARYALGVALQPLDWLAVLVDVLGTSDLKRETFTQAVGPVDPGLSFASASFVTNVAAGSDRQIVASYAFPRFDMVNIAAGFEFALFDQVAAYVSAIVPLTHQGLQAPVIPTGGVAYNF